MFPPTLLSCSSRFLHALRQNRAQSRLLYLLNCPTFQIASWSALIAKLWQQPTTIFALLSPFCLFIFVREIFKRHRNDLRDRSGDQIRRGRCRKSLGVSPALDEVWGESLGPIFLDTAITCHARKNTLSCLSLTVFFTQDTVVSNRVDFSVRRL